MASSVFAFSLVHSLSIANASSRGRPFERTIASLVFASATGAPRLILRARPAIRPRRTSVKHRMHRAWRRRRVARLGDRPGCGEARLRPLEDAREGFAKLANVTVRGKVVIRP